MNQARFITSFPYRATGAVSVIDIRHVMPTHILHHQADAICGSALTHRHEYHTRNALKLPVTSLNMLDSLCVLKKDRFTAVATLDDVCRHVR